MTSAVQDRPSTTLDLLFGPGEDAPGALAHQILSAGTDGNLGRALESLPTATRQAAVHEATTAAAGLLDVDLLGLLVAGWREHHDLIAAARRTLAAPASTELVDLATHQITTTRSRPSASWWTVSRVAILQLGLSVVFDVSAILALISAGRLVALHSGRCDITATLTIQGTDVLTRRAHLELPGVVPLARESGCWPPGTTRSARSTRKAPMTTPPSKWHLGARPPVRCPRSCAGPAQDPATGRTSHHPTLRSPCSQTRADDGSQVRSRAGASTTSASAPIEVVPPQSELVAARSVTPGGGRPGRPERGAFPRAGVGG